MESRFPTSVNIKIGYSISHQRQFSAFYRNCARFYDGQMQSASSSIPFNTPGFAVMSSGDVCGGISLSALEFQDARERQTFIKLKVHVMRARNCLQCVFVFSVAELDFYWLNVKLVVCPALCVCSTYSLPAAAARYLSWACLSSKI
jgi:hypothetical protein